MSALDGRVIGVIGLGLMGRPMARNLHRAGARVIIWNRSPGPLQALAAEGLEPAASPKAVAETAEVVIVMVADTDAVAAVLHGPDGVLAGLSPDSLVIDMGTTAVSATRRFAAEVAEHGAAYVDAPVSGGEQGAIDGTLTIMAGGSDAAFGRALSVFTVLGRTISRVGGVGAGQVAKAANQVIVGLTIGAVAEAVVLAERAGVEADRLREALMGGFASSRVLDLHGRRMADRAFRPGGKVTTQRKDLDQALQLAAELGVELPATRLCRDLYDRLIAAGDGGLDHSALYRLIAGEAGVPDPAVPLKGR